MVSHASEEQAAPSLFTRAEQCRMASSAVVTVILLLMIAAGCSVLSLTLVTALWVVCMRASRYLSQRYEASVAGAAPNAAITVEQLVSSTVVHTQRTQVRGHPVRVETEYQSSHVWRGGGEEAVFSSYVDHQERVNPFSSAPFQGDRSSHHGGRTADVLMGIPVEGPSFTAFPSQPVQSIVSVLHTNIERGSMLISVSVTTPYSNGVRQHGVRPASGREEVNEGRVTIVNDGGDDSSEAVYGHAEYFAIPPIGQTGTERGGLRSARASKS